MDIDITELASGLKKSIDVNENISIYNGELLENTDLIEIRDLLFCGKIYIDCCDQYHIDLDVNGIMVLPCSITLKSVYYKFSCKIEENYNEDEWGNLKKLKNFRNTIDIMPIIWENIVLEIPLKVLSSDAYNTELEGDGWKFISNVDQEGEE